MMVVSRERVYMIGVSSSLSTTTFCFLLSRWLGSRKAGRLVTEKFRFAWHRLGEGLALMITLVPNSEATFRNSGSWIQSCM